ncbi:MAG: response regulator [Lachnospiraceae bacterium]|nr:response regulator [Lachnospiraceae bacterium]
MGKTILVIDDDAMNLRMAEFLLTKNDYTVRKADSGQKGIEILKTEAIDLTLLDIEMPVMNGIETLERIRADEEICRNKVAILTASISDELREKTDALGAVGYIKKPFMPAELQAKMEAVIG